MKMVNDTLIRVWPFEDAPLQYQALSPHGGDEDWVAVVPAALADRYIGWLAPGTPFGCYTVSIHALPDGARLYIGTHS